MFNYSEIEKELLECQEQVEFHSAKVLELREITKRTGYLNKDVECSGSFKNGILTLNIKHKVPPHIKQMGARKLNRSQIYLLQRDNQKMWNEIVKRSLGVALRSSEDSFNAFKRPVIYIFATEDNARVKKTGSFAFYLIHNALKINNVIDISEKVQFAYSFKGRYSGEYKLTELTIFNNDQKWSKDSCHICPINRIYLNDRA